MPGRTFPMQPWTTRRGVSATTFNMVLPREYWVDGEDAEEVCLAVDMPCNVVSAGSTYCALVFETASCVEGPWTSLLTIADANFTKTTRYFTSKESGTNKFQRFIRYQIVPGAVSGNWTMTFKICASVR